MMEHQLDEFDTSSIYFKVVKIAKEFFDNRGIFTVDVLADINPSVEQLAKSVKTISELISLLSNDFSDQNMAINAKQCSLELFQLATAVKDFDHERTQELLHLLEKYTKGPY